MRGAVLTTAALCFMTGILALGCAPAPLPRGDALLGTGDYADAVRSLRAETARNPEDARAKRNLGVAYFQTGDFEHAAETLDDAQTLAPEDPLVAYFRGRTAEAAGDRPRAVEAYNRYIELTGERPPELLTRLRTLARAQAEEDVRRAIQAETSLGSKALPENTVAVPGYAEGGGNPDLAPLGRGLAVVLISDLSKVADLRVVERERLQVLLDELDLASPGPPAEPAMEDVATVTGLKQRLRRLVDPDTDTPYYAGPMDSEKNETLTEAVRAFQEDHGLTQDGIPGPQTQAAIAQAAAPPATPPGPVDRATAPRLGRLLGAGRVIQGTFSGLGNSSVQLDAVIASVGSGKLTPVGDAVRGPLENVLRLQKKLTYEILAALGVAVPPELKKRLDKLPTESFPAFLAFSRGLDFEARGMTPQAIDAYREALRLDNRFSMAREAEEIAALPPGAEDAFDGARVEDALRRPVGPETADRLARTGVWIGIGPGPDGDRTDATDPSVTSVEKVEQATILIEGDLPPRGGK